MGAEPCVAEPAGVKGAIRITLDKGGTEWGVPVYSLSPLRAEGKQLSPGEQAVYAALLAGL
jgi:hypothetical protein